METLEIMVYITMVVSWSCTFYLWGYRNGLAENSVIKIQEDNINSEYFLEKRVRKGKVKPNIKFANGRYFDKTRPRENITSNQHKRKQGELQLNKDKFLGISTRITKKHIRECQGPNGIIISVLNAVDLFDGYFGEDVFSFCNGLKMAVIHGGDIGPGAFCFCRSLTKVAVLSGTECVGEGAFAYCKKLKYAFFADSVRKIGRGVFDGCDALEMVILPSKYFNDDGVLDEKMRIYIGLKTSVACYRGQGEASCGIDHRGKC